MKAKEMFKKLGYKQEIGKDYIEYKQIKTFRETRYWQYEVEYYILFDLERKDLSIGTDNNGYIHNINIDILQAILQQVKELKWEKKNLVK